jgi:hypothetical protein
MNAGLVLQLDFTNPKGEFELDFTDLTKEDP